MNEVAKLYDNAGVAKIGIMYMNMRKDTIYKESEGK